MEDRTRAANRLHWELTIYFPEYKDAFGKKTGGTFTLELLKEAPVPEDIVSFGTDGVRNVWREAKLRGRGYRKAAEIVRLAEESIGLKDGICGGRETIRWFAQQAMDLQRKIDDIERQLYEKCRELPNAENVLEIKGIGENILAGILAEMGDISRFDDVREIQKISGLGLVACNSGKHKGETRISHRGRKRLRYRLFQAAKSAVTHAEEFRTLHIYYTMWAENPLKKMQSLIAIACKILRIIYTLLKTGRKYDPEKMLKDIRHPAEKKTAQAA